MEVMLALLVVPTHCINSVSVHKVSNPFVQVRNTPLYLPRPCKYSCLFCLGDYGNIAPSLNRAGVCMALMDLFSGGNRTSGDITFLPVLLDKIKQYPRFN